MPSGVKWQYPTHEEADDPEADVPSHELTVAESGGQSPVADPARFLVALVGEEKLQALVERMDAFLSQDVPEGEFREPDAALQWEMDELGRLARDTLARPQKKQVRLGHRQGPNRRPARRESRRRRNVRTRRAKARSPGSSSDDGPSEGESGPAAHSQPPLDLVDIAVLVRGWGRV